jgi:DNA-3-methyladenine glycosylase
MPQNIRPKKYNRQFFERPADDVARDLVGSVLVLRDGDLEISALLVETEAYGGSDDPASHAYRGPTRRSAVMFGPPGYLYVYRIYGLHWCLNVVTGPEGSASAVLLRAAELLDSSGDDASRGERTTILRGPGNLTRGLGITGARLTRSNPWFVGRESGSRKPPNDSPGTSSMVTARSRDRGRHCGPELQTNHSAECW